MGANLNLSRQQIAANAKKTPVTALQAQLSLANAQHAADEKKLLELLEVVKEQEELKEVKKSLATADNEKAIAEARLQDAVQDLKSIDGVAKELVACQKELRLAKAELGKVQRAMKEAQRQSASKQKDVEDSVKNVEDGLREIAELEAKLEEKSKQIDKLEGEVDKQKARTEHFEEAANGHLKMKKDMEKMVKSLTAEVVKLRGRPKEVGGKGRVDFGLDWA